MKKRADLRKISKGVRAYPEEWEKIKEAAEKAGLFTVDFVILAGLDETAKFHSNIVPEEIREIMPHKGNRDTSTTKKNMTATKEDWQTIIEYADIHGFNVSEFLICAALLKART